MHTVVAIKQVPDTSNVRINPETGTLIREGVIDGNDMDLLSVVNTPDEVLDTIFRYYEESGFETSEAEREIKLNL